MMSTSSSDTVHETDPLFVSDPVASPSGRFPLARPSGEPLTDDPSPAGARPWNLRRMGPVMHPTGRLGAMRYDPVRQVNVAAEANDQVDTQLVVAGPPTAPTTSTVDGEDPPSSEDYINDYHPDESP